MKGYLLVCSTFNEKKEANFSLELEAIPKLPSIIKNFTNKRIINENSKNILEEQNQDLMEEFE